MGYIWVKYELSMDIYLYSLVLKGRMIKDLEDQTLVPFGVIKHGKLGSPM